MSDEIRDSGPFRDRDQVANQFRNWSTGMPGVLPAEGAVALLLTEALMIAGVEPTSYEMDVLAGRDLDPEFAQILAGWLIRARHPNAASPAGDER